MALDACREGARYIRFLMLDCCGMSPEFHEVRARGSEPLEEPHWTFVLVTNITISDFRDPVQLEKKKEYGECPRRVRLVFPTQTRQSGARWVRLRFGLEKLSDTTRSRGTISPRVCTCLFRRATRRHHTCGDESVVELGSVHIFPRQLGWNCLRCELPASARLIAF